MGILAHTRLLPLMNISNGSPDITIGIIDGPVDLNHPAFRESKIKTVRASQQVACKNASDMACIHGTFVTGILCAKRGLPAPAICPNCEFVVYPIFSEIKKEDSKSKQSSDFLLPSATLEDLSN